MKKRVTERQLLAFIMIIVAFVAIGRMMSVSACAEATAKTRSIVLNHSTYILKKGNTVKLKVLAMPKKLKNQKFVWKSSKNSVAFVNSKGVVKGKKKGCATISLTIKGTSLKAFCKIIVETSAETRVELDLEEKIKRFRG